MKNHIAPTHLLFTKAKLTQQLFKHYLLLLAILLPINFAHSQTNSNLALPKIAVYAKTNLFGYMSHDTANMLLIKTTIENLQPQTNSSSPLDPNLDAQYLGIADKYATIRLTWRSYEIPVFLGLNNVLNPLGKTLDAEFPLVPGRYPLGIRTTISSTPTYHYERVGYLVIQDVSNESNQAYLLYIQAP